MIPSTADFGSRAFVVKYFKQNEKRSEVLLFNDILFNFSNIDSSSHRPNVELQSAVTHLYTGLYSQSFFAS